ncbi:MAG: secondary thiamine-phosphate synthase enzyme YjbQ [Nanoarchaeota archaeon]|nr:secondary thiamine-phosphate synthase enzyme YjbQ [Nanoarchaeota archaeon]
MKCYSEILKLKTKEALEFIDITDKIKKIVDKYPFLQGYVNIFSRHTTMAIKINESEKLLMQDFKNFFEKIAPKNSKYFHDKIELRQDCPENEPKNTNGHLRCMVMETSQNIPIINKEMALGQWQRIFAVETCSARDREIVVQVCGN